jgi:glycosyltransferase involved in cell wall biosynthesis
VLCLKISRIKKFEGGMKILILSSIFPPHIFGGAEVAAYNMARLLVARGHEVHVATTAELGEPPAWGEAMAEGYKLYRLDIPRQHTLFGRQEHGGGAAQKVIWHAQDYFDPRNTKIIRKLLDDVRPDHIDIHNITGIGYNTLPLIGDGKASVAYILHDLGLACFNTSMFKDDMNCKGQCSGCQISSGLRLSQLN